MDLVYSYDEVGNITGKTDNGQSTVYGYNDRDRLTSVDYPEAAPFADESFDYDPTGNRTAYQGQTWSYNSNNQLTLSVEDSVTTSDYAYDDNGQTAVKDGRSYAYDVRNRLASVTEGASTLQTNAYDPFGRRIWKENGAGQKTFFIYADEGLIAETDSTGTITQSYGWAPDGLWGTDPVYTRTPAQGYAYYLNDHLGTPQRLMKGNGAVVWKAEYEAFGEASVSVSIMNNNLRFPGQYYDAETGAHYNYFRDYDPGLGRYLQSDPIGLAGGLNAYGYVGGRPLQLIDPRGLAGFFGIELLVDGGPLPFAFGGGLIRVSCRDECGKLRHFNYYKVCVGTEGGFQALGGGVTNMSGAKCEPNAYTGYFVEFAAGAAGIVVGVDIGLSDDDLIPNGFSGVNEAGVGTGGSGAGIQLCHYSYIGEHKGVGSE